MSPTCSGLGSGEKCCAAQQHATALGDPNSHSSAALCWVPGQGTPAYSLGPHWSHEPSASSGKRVRVCFAAEQDVANPGLYFFSCDSLSFVLPNTMTRGEAAGAVCK